MTSRETTLRFGTRGSALALAQTALVIGAIAARRPELRGEPVVIQTEGDRDQLSPLTVIGGHGVFTSALQEALRRGDVDAAVHSAKDLPSLEPPDLRLTAFLARDDPRDVFISRHGCALEELGPQPVIGTSSRRRAVQIRRLRPDARIAELRGNVDTRLRKALETGVDGIVLAAAGIGRLGWADRITEYLPLDRCVPSPGQGALVVEVRAFDEGPASALDVIDEPAVSSAVRVERAFLRATGGGCTMPVGAYAEVEGDRIRLRAMIASDDGARAEWADETYPMTSAEFRAGELASRLMRSVGRVARASNGAWPERTVPERSAANGAPPTMGVAPDLSGLAVLVTAGAGSSEDLVAALRARGAEPLVLPTIRIDDPADLSELDAAIDRLQAGRYDWVAFTSKNAVERVLRRLRERGLAPRLLKRAKVAAVGSATARLLERDGVVVEVVPARFTAEAVLAAMVVRGVGGQRVLFARGDLARDVLSSGLVAAGTVVDSVIVYRTVAETGVDPPLLAQVRAGAVDVVTLLSPSGVRNLVSLVDGRVDALNRATIACIGPETAAAARDLGLRVDIVPEILTVPGLVGAIARHGARRRADDARAEGSL